MVLIMHLITKYYWLQLNIAFLLLATLTGCYEPFMASGQGVQVVHESADSEDPDQYKVISNSYPTLHTKSDFFPVPSKLGRMPEIKSSDNWHVTHKFKDKILIYSEEYQLRYWENIGGSSREAPGSTLFHIWINSSGQPEGWQILKNPEFVVFHRDRYVIFKPEKIESYEWPVVNFVK